MTMKTKIASLLSAAALIATGASAGTITPIGTPASNPTPDGQVLQNNHGEILGDIFGGTFVANGVNFSNGVVEVTRVDDDNDQTYDFLEWEAHAVARWAGANQGFGTGDGKIFDVTGQFSAVTGQILGQPGGEGIEFVRYGDENGTVTASTNPASNPNGQDHAVTYTWTVNGVPAANRYLIFFEDSNESSVYTDTDYNDLVVEVIGTPIPEPGSLALIGLGGLAMLRRRR
ncbi:MAG: PEP-CTERM sorting domain-containing protein [Phycisphaeraceae bacterium]